MLYKVIVLEIKEKYALAMKQGGEVIRIKLKSDMHEGDKIYVVDDDLFEEEFNVIAFTPKKKNKKIISSFISVAAAFVLVFTMFTYINVPSAYAVVSLSGEKEIQLELDRNHNVLSCKVNGNQISKEESESIKGKNLNDLQKELSGILGEGPVLIGYASNDGQDDDWAEQTLRKMFSENIILYLNGEKKDISEAEMNDLFLGLYLSGKIMEDEHIEEIDDILEDYFDHIESGEDDDERDVSHLEDMDLEQIIEEINKNPEYKKNDEVIEILADKVEDLQEEQEEKEEKARKEAEKKKKEEEKRKEEEEKRLKKEQEKIKEEKEDEEDSDD